MNPNPYHYEGRATNGPALGSFPITPNDGANLPTNIRAVTLNVGGSISWVGWDGESYETAVLPAGTYPLRASRIRATGTTAAELTGWV